MFRNTWCTLDSVLRVGKPQYMQMNSSILTTDCIPTHVSKHGLERRRQVAGTAPRGSHALHGMNKGLHATRMRTLVLSRPDSGIDDCC